MAAMRLQHAAAPRCIVWTIATKDPHAPAQGRARAAAIRCSMAVLALLLPTAATAATNHVVTALSNLTFSPSNLTITAGDTVTFKNGGGFHNVASDPGAITTFRCASGCDGAGGNGNLSSAAWSATVAFPTAGTAAFHCEAHGAAGGVGMSGRITIQPAVATPARRNDFDGDGHSDVLWRNGSTGADSIWRSANSATKQAVAAQAVAWSVAGTTE
jgi:plastocyanin